MGEGLVNYIERIELLAFFSGYPLIYAIVYVFAGDKTKIQTSFVNRLVNSLPFAYALTGTLYLGLVLKNIHPDYSFKNITDQFENSFIKIWGLLAILFWIPLLSKKTIFSLLHSFVFFFFLLKDLFMYMNSSIDREMIQNDMKIYTTSLLINTATLLFIVMMHFILKRISNNKKISSD